MSDHPIEALMQTAMESIKDMVDVNTVVGEPVETNDGSVIIPVSRVSCGFAAGGSEFPTPNPDKSGKDEGVKLPFGGGSGAGVSVQPVGFLVVAKDEIRFLPVAGNVFADRLIDLAPRLLNQIQGMLDKKERKEMEIKSSL
ncbi:MAG TPA: sporulation protein YtfJ [Clostridia bacterium]|nr:sporulation protein YtfJ [Clostridia bacterium]